MGITTQLRDAMMATDGISREEANRCFWLIDREGLLVEESGVGKGTEENDLNTDSRREFYRPKEERWAKGDSGMVGLLDVVRRARPTVLIGVSTCEGAFTEEVVQAMVTGLGAEQRPIILPLSNPSRLAEAKPVDLLKWSDGRALVASGSPFGTVKANVGGKEKEVV
jgi:malate dehydrogenase (oxaloacetate-decarboxylating)